jgi:ATP-dependent Clp protease ATP-binding subunit ClpB
MDFIAQSGYDPVYGARPLKRAIQRLLENPIATKILETTFAEGAVIVVALEDGALVFDSREKAVASEATLADDASTEGTQPPKVGSAVGSTISG